jgi:hypothetical protein
MMRPLAALALAILAGTLPGTPAAARPYQAAVFDIELLDTSQEAGAGERGDQTRRLQLVSEELRKLLAASGQIALVDLAPKAAEIEKQSPLFKCNGCDEDLAKALGADLVVSGYVQKTSNLILAFVVTVKEAATGKLLRAGQVDIRGNNDEMWLRGIRYAVRNRILAEPLPERS